MKELACLRVLWLIRALKSRERRAGKTIVKKKKKKIKVIKKKKKIRQYSAYLITVRLHV